MPDIQTANQPSEVVGNMQTPEIQGQGPLFPSLGLSGVSPPLSASPNACLPGQALFKNTMMTSQAKEAEPGGSLPLLNA